MYIQKYFVLYNVREKILGEDRVQILILSKEPSQDVIDEFELAKTYECCEHV